MRCCQHIVVLALMLSLCCSGAQADRPEDAGGQPHDTPPGLAGGGPPGLAGGANPAALQRKEKFNFGDCGGAKACLGVERIDALLRKSGMAAYKSADELAQQLDEDADFGLDVENDMLIYACRGSAVAAAVAQDPQQAAAAGGNRKLHAHQHHHHAHGSHQHHHHHHHRRSLQQRGGGGSVPAPAPAPSPAPAPEVANAEVASGYQPGALDVPVTSIMQAQAFTLHSRPTAARKVFLDFNGHTTTGTAWNSAAYPSIVSRPFDKDGNPATWSQQELSDIFGIWRAVSEDFSVFDVDITTEEPPAAVLANGTRVVIGGSGLDWRGERMGGTSYVNAFGTESGEFYKPAFVFAEDLYNEPKYIWEAVSHELGHQLGLSHDGDATNAYYGATAGTPGWAPIMGYNYAATVTQFSKGDYPGANNLEDDFSVMSRYLAYIPQEHGSSTAAASALAFPSKSKTATVSAVLRGPTDADVFSFVTSRSGTISVQFQPLAPWGSAPRSNLLATVQLLFRTTTGTRLVAQRSGQSLGSFAFTISAASQAAGSYFVSVTPAASSADYSSYGNRGQFQLTVVTP